MLCASSNSDPVVYQDSGFEISPEFPRIVRFAEIFRKIPFVLLSNPLVQGMTDIQPNLAEWRHPTGLEPFFQGSHEKSVIGSSGASPASGTKI